MTHEHQTVDLDAARGRRKHFAVRDALSLAARMRAFPALMVAAIAVGSIMAPAMAAEPSAPDAKGQERVSVIMPLVDAARGRRLFVTKGCFVCHSVRGVGGKAAPALDAQTQSGTIDVVGFVARMWRGAPIMFQLQTLELGYRIELSADEIADLAGFVTLARAQNGFSVQEIPEILRDWIIDEAYWKDPSIDWREKLPDRFPDIDERTPQ